MTDYASAPAGFVPSASCVGSSGNVRNLTGLPNYGLILEQDDMHTLGPELRTTGKSLEGAELACCYCCWAQAMRPQQQVSDVICNMQ